MLIKELMAGEIIYGEAINLSNYNWNENEIKKFQTEFETIVAFLNKSINQNNFQQLFNSCLNIVSSIPLPLVQIDANFILRARANYNGEVFKEQLDISYNTKNIKKIELNRFNRPEESMFYGAAPTDEQTRLIATVTLECCKEIVDDQNNIKQQYFTFGKWNVKEFFPVVNLCFHEKTLKINPNLKGIITKYLDEAKEHLSDVSVAFLKEYWYFLSDLACKKHATDQQYFITTAYITALKEYYKDSFNGIIYPSSMTDMEGLNIVLTPHAVDKFLDLKEVFMYKCMRDPKGTKLLYGGKCSNISEVKDQKFAISGIC